MVHGCELSVVRTELIAIVGSGYDMIFGSLWNKLLPEVHLCPL